jgi:hypothetical protein
MRLYLAKGGSSRIPMNLHSARRLNEDENRMLRNLVRTTRILYKESTDDYDDAND